MYCTDNITWDVFFYLFLATVNTHQAYNADQFYALTSGSYRCKAKSKFQIGDEVEMNTYNLQYAAFQDNIKGFSNQGKISVSLLFFPPNFS